MVAMPDEMNTSFTEVLKTNLPTKPKEKFKKYRQTSSD